MTENRISHEPRAAHLYLHKHFTLHYFTWRNLLQTMSSLASTSSRPMNSPVYAGLKLPAHEKRSVFFRGDPCAGGVVVMVNQPLLPEKFSHHVCKSVDDVYVAINTMIVRGAPAIGVTGAYGMVLAAAAHAGQPATSEAKDARASVSEALVVAKERLDKARPTAVNLMWATNRMVEFSRSLQSAMSAAEIVTALLGEANRLADDDMRLNLRMAKHGAAVVPEFKDRATNIIHHCNTGALACVDWGTALGVIHFCHSSGRNIHVWVDETRPRLQGARLSAWELMQGGRYCFRAVPRSFSWRHISVA